MALTDDGSFFDSWFGDDSSDDSTSDDDYGTSGDGADQDSAATENVDDGSDEFKLTEGKILTKLGLGTGALATIKAFTDDPLAFILGEILPWIVGGILDGWSTVLGAFLSAFEPLTTIPSTLADPLGTAGSAILGPIVGILETLNGALVGLAQASGPFAPLVVGGIWIGIGAVASYAISSIPVVGQIKTLLGVIR